MALERRRSLELVPGVWLPSDETIAARASEGPERMPGGPLVTSRAARVGRTKRKKPSLAGQRRWQRYFAVVRGLASLGLAAPRGLS